MRRNDDNRTYGGVESGSGGGSFVLIDRRGVGRSLHSFRMAMGWFGGSIPLQALFVGSGKLS